MTEPTCFFTFGCGHPLKNGVIVASGDWNEARRMMHDTFGPKWAFQYPIEELPEQQARFGYTVIGELWPGEDSG